jgi:hypothetical protein
MILALLPAFSVGNLLFAFLTGGTRSMASTAIPVMASLRSNMRSDEGVITGDTQNII